jgi:hypothetical protein
MGQSPMNTESPSPKAGELQMSSKKETTIFWETNLTIFIEVHQYTETN